MGGAIPLSTYRLQLSPRFTLKSALDVVPYLDALGITHVYTSPFLKARPGSEHGYDITDHNALNPEIGDWDDFVRFSDALRAAGMGLILDFVPNHMGIGRADNAWWLDVLQWGRGSIYSDYFDIDWLPAQPWLKGRVLLPILGDHYGTVLIGGQLVLRFAAAEGTLSVRYHDHRLPLRPRSYAVVIRRALAAGRSDPRGELAAFFERIAHDLDGVERTARREAARHRLAAVQAELVARCAGDGEAARFMADATAAFNGTAVDYSRFVSMLPEIDIVIASTGATNYILTKEDMQRVISARKNRPMFLIDIAVPRNIDPGVNDLDNLFLYDIDDLQGVVNQNLKERNREAEHAEEIVGHEVEKMIARLHVQEIAPTIVSLQEQLEEIRASEVAKAMRKMQGLTAEQREAIDYLTKAIINKVAHGPISALRSHAGDPEGAHVISAIRRVFHIE